jgi:CheY-like chemotaxis protein
MLVCGRGILIVKREQLWVNTPNAFGRASRYDSAMDASDGAESRFNFGRDKQTLLYVEDDPAQVALFYTAVRQAGIPSFRLQLAKGIEEAMDYFMRVRVRPAGVLLDYLLGNFRSMDLLHWMRGQPNCASVEVAMFGCSEDLSQIAECYGAGADYYLVKPGDFDELARIAMAIALGFATPSKHRVLYQLVGSRAYRHPAVELHRDHMARGRATRS